MKPASAKEFAEIFILGPSPVRELPGAKNRSAIIDAFNANCGVAFGSPYCATGTSFCFAMAARTGAGGEAFPVGAGSQRIMAWFRNRDRATSDPQRMLGWEGALFGWTNPDGQHGHIGIVAGRLTDSEGKIVGIRTLEFNTSKATKDRDGEGAYQLERTLVELKASHPRFWFLDTSGIAGGQWFLPRMGDGV